VNWAVVSARIIAGAAMIGSKDKKRWYKLEKALVSPHITLSLLQGFKHCYLAVNRRIRSSRNFASRKSPGRR
jgi:hypothetical protein